MITISKIDETKIHLDSNDRGALMELHECFTFYADNYKFMPAFRNKTWNGKIHLFDSRAQTLPYGLLPETLEFAKSRGYDVTLDKGFLERSAPKKEELERFVDELDIRSSGQRISPRPYQTSAFCHSLREGRSLVISPTGSGKSLIIYLLLRWRLIESDEKILIVVPTTSLVEQMKKDFADYSSHDPGFDAEKEVHQIYSGKEKNVFSSRVVVTTWQSAVNLRTEWFLQFSTIIGDEAHLFKAKSLNKIMGMLKNAEVRIGTTGTLDGSVCNELVLVGHFGPTHSVITTKELISSSTLASLKIKCLVLQHEPELKKVVSKLDYQGEIGAIVEHEGRNRFISNLALSQNGNTLVLYNLVDRHGKPLYDLICKCAREDRRVFFVSGDVDVKDRELTREITEKEKDAIIVASMGTFSTGINIRNLHTIIFAAPTKSQIRVLQSIGRGLRKSDDGRGTTVYDISDNFSWKNKKNYTMKHAMERISIYTRESFEYKVYEIPLPLK
jgi:superfamily II DNA or RNA helicase